MSIQPDSFPGAVPEITLTLPPQITDAEVADSLKDSADTGGQILNILSSGNVILSLVLGGSMEHLWGMIRAMQLIILSALV